MRTYIYTCIYTHIHAYTTILEYFGSEIGPSPVETWTQTLKLMLFYAFQVDATQGILVVEEVAAESLKYMHYCQQEALHGSTVYQST